MVPDLRENIEITFENTLTGLTLLLIVGMISFNIASVDGPETPETQVLDCSDLGERCQERMIEKTIVNCNEWYPGQSTSQLGCIETTEGLEEVTMITDAGNHIRSSFSGREPEIENQPSLGYTEGPWDLEFFKDGSYLITYRNGTLAHHTRNGSVKSTDSIGDVYYRKADTFGLLGAATDPNYSENHRIYLYYTYAENTDLSETFEPLNGSEIAHEEYNLNRVSSFRWEDGELRDEKVLVEGIPGQRHKSGGRLQIGPENRLFVTTGDGGYPEMTEDPGYLGGKILRVNLDGSIPEDNPFDNPVYATGFKNPQGLSWHPETGELYATEHGPWRHDQINRIEKGSNYGWPHNLCGTVFNESESAEIFVEDVYERESGEIAIREPVKEPVWCIEDWTLAPSGMEFVDDPGHPWHEDLFVAGLRGKQIHRFRIEDGELRESEIFYVNRNNTGSIGRRFREVEYRDGELWVLGDREGVARLSPQG